MSVHTTTGEVKVGEEFPGMQHTHINKQNKTTEEGKEGLDESVRADP